MAYDGYRAKGYPIGSGMVEGATFSRMSSTVIRVPRITGLPSMIFGSAWMYFSILVFTSKLPTRTSAGQSSVFLSNRKSCPVRSSARFYYATTPEKLQAERPALLPQSS